ncbi:helix-turn-helix domain-containing protein [Actinophytocola sp.]|uniref:helix-turn-helix domain-containing protein n=1 Tax=Actinophytocola sp. TaxID=1872138 RepID=UPI002ED2054B
MTIGARVDEGIPPLVTATTAAGRLGCSVTWLGRLVQQGRLPGVKVGRQVVLPETVVAALAEQRRRGVEGWDAPETRLPALVSPSKAAPLLDFAQGNSVVALYQDGKLPGRKVGNDIVLRRDVVTALAALRRAGIERYPGA